MIQVDVILGFSTLHLLPSFYLSLIILRDTVIFGIRTFWRTNDLPFCYFPFPLLFTTFFFYRRHFLVVFTGAFSGDDPKDMRIGCESRFIHGYYIAVIGTTFILLKKKKRLTLSCLFPYECPRFSMFSMLGRYPSFR